MTDFRGFPLRRVALIAAGAAVAAIIPIAAATAGGWHSHGSFGLFFGVPGYYAPPAYYPPPAYYAPQFYGPPPGYYRPYPAVQAAAPPPPPPAQAQDFTVYFDFDRWELTAAGSRVVDQAIAQARQSGAAQIQVGGFTDLAGTTSYNYALAQGRAVAVRNYMVAQGIPAEQIVVKSFGKNDPRVRTPDGVREAQNRRVEIVISPPANVSYGQPPYQGYGQMPSQGYNAPPPPGYYSN
jgi:outer membrane protein OmpA-like peptidoglycan-associated protein